MCCGNCATCTIHSSLASPAPCHTAVCSCDPTVTGPNPLCAPGQSVGSLALEELEVEVELVLARGPGNSHANVPASQLQLVN